VIDLLRPDLVVLALVMLAGSFGLAAMGIWAKRGLQRLVSTVLDGCAVETR
jgi:hypothetical protein